MQVVSLEFYLNSCVILCAACMHRLRAQFGTNKLRNAVHASSTTQEASAHIAKIFGTMDYDSEGRFTIHVYRLSN